MKKLGYSTGCMSKGFTEEIDDPRQTLIDMIDYIDKNILSYETQLIELIESYGNIVYEDEVPCETCGDYSTIYEIGEEK